MPTNRLIERFTFREGDFEATVTDANTELDTVGSFVSLVADPVTGLFPTVADGVDEAQVATRLFTPTTCRGWLMIESDIVHKRAPRTNALVTAARFRVNDGASAWWWDGAAWAVAAAPAEWNTEAEINANLATFPFTARALRIVVNLQTTDGRVAPELHGIKLLWRSDVAWEEDVVYRTVIRALRAGLAPVARAKHQLAATASSFALHWRVTHDSTVPTGAATIEGGYDVIGIEAVFDLATDPNRLANLASAFTATSTTSGTVTLTGPVTAPGDLEIHFVYRPEVAVDRHRDDIKPAYIPAVIITTITHEGETQKVQGADLIVDRATGTAVRLPSPRQGDIRFGFRIEAERTQDRARLSDEICCFFDENALIRSAGLDRSYTVQLVDEFSSARDPGLEGILESDGAFVVYSVVRFVRSASDEVGVSRLRLRVDGEQNPFDIVGT
jgi:hypothetical protein